MADSKIPREIRRSLLRSEAELAMDLGWSIERTRGGHLKWTPPTGKFVIMPGTPSDRRSYLNARSMLRRHGLPRVG